MLRTGTRLAATALVVVLVAGACGASDGDGVATPADTSAPPPATEPAPVVEPAPAPSEQPPEPPPTEPAAEPAPTEPAAPEPPPPPAAEQPEEPAEPAGVATGPLDEAAVAELFSAIAAAEAGVTSSLVEMYLSLSLSMDGESAGGASDLPLTVVTSVGDLTHTWYDPAALAAVEAFEGGPPEDLTPVEFIFDGGAQQFFVKLESLLGESDIEELGLPEGTVVGDDISVLWGKVTMGSGDPELDGMLEMVDFVGQTAYSDFLELLQAAGDGDAVLEATGEGPGETAGVPTARYRFVLDLGALTEDLPAFVGGLLGEGPTAGAAPEGFLEGIGPLRVELMLQVDGDGIVRELGFHLDLGAIMTAIFEGFAEGSDGAEGFVPEIEYLLSVRFRTVAVNDPALSVTVPDESAVIDLGEMLSDRTADDA